MGIERERHVDKITPEEYLYRCLSLAKKWENPPQVELSLMSADPDGVTKLGPRDVAVSTAYQCYNEGITRMKRREGEKADGVADSTLEAGHHTTRMHFYITWHLKGVSRDTVHEIFNAARFYNSEQQSQRYAEVEKGAYLIPRGLSFEQRQMFLEAADFANDSYFELIELLAPEVERRVREMYPPGGWKVPKTAERLQTKINKICLEVARYLLPIAQKTTMFYTLNEIQLLRLFRASMQDNFSDEARYVIARMVEEVAKQDDNFLKELPSVLPERPRSYSERQIFDANEEFDEMLGGRSTVLLSAPSNFKEILATSVRNALKVTKSEMGDRDALLVLLDPRLNTVLSDTYETGMLDSLVQSLLMVYITFATKLSHSADSQRQRHRTTPGATPTIAASYNGKPDYITPMIIREDMELKEKYDSIMVGIYENVENLIKAGVPKEAALMLLPNAHTIRVVESGNLFDWIHRFKQRLCILAQEEISFITVEQAQALLDVLPEAENLLLPPCALSQRAGTGRCPEEDRWCGQPVWKWELPDFKKGRLV